MHDVIITFIPDFFPIIKKKSLQYSTIRNIKVPYQRDLNQAK